MNTSNSNQESADTSVNINTDQQSSSMDQGKDEEVLATSSTQPLEEDAGGRCVFIMNKPLGFKGFTCYFLREPIVTVFKHEVLAIRWAAGEDSMGLLELHRDDMLTIFAVERAMEAAFPYKYPVKEIFKTDDRGTIVFVKVNANETKIYLDKNQQVALSALPNSFNCRVALQFKGIKIKNYESSLMFKMCQLKVGKSALNEDKEEYLFN